MALFNNNNTAANQLTLITLLVNTALIGNYVPGYMNVTVTGILHQGAYMNTTVNLLPYFTGQTMTDNLGGIRGSVNYIDSGGEAALNQSKPAFNVSSRQYHLVTSLYSYFGTLLGCSRISNATDAIFPAYTGQSMMYELHKYMNLTFTQLNYFITQVGLSAASFGVANSDIMTVANVLNTTFNRRCSPPQAVVTPDPELQSLCTAPSCPLSDNANCSLYEEANINPTASQLVSTASGMAAVSAATPLRISIPMNAARLGDKAYVPNPAFAKVGQQIVWINTDTVPHTVTSTGNSRLLDSPVLMNGDMFTFSFTAAGTYNYYCSIHPTMVGMVMASE